MQRKVLRTLLVALISGAALLFLLLPALDALGSVLLMPPSYGPAARVLVGAFWLVGIAAAWAYQPPGPPEAGG